jgi:aminoglycoside phosphotransferase (APT) family kinase protein
MGDKGDADWVSPSKIHGIVSDLEPSWNIQRVEPINEGLNTAFRIDVNTSESDEFYIFKTSKRSPGKIMGEYRLHYLLNEETTIPIPEVYHGFDGLSEFRSPFFIMEGIHGDHLQRYPQKPSLETERTIAKELGRYIGQLQEIDIFSKFGDIRKSNSESTKANNRYGLAIKNGHSTWPSRLREAALDIIDSVSETTFKDLTPEMKRVVNSEIDAMDENFRTVIGRIDYYYENMLVNERHDSIRSLIDWDLAMTVEPEYDLACAEAALCGPLDLASNRRNQIRSALERGYETVRSRSKDWSKQRRLLYLLVQYSVRLLWDPLEVVVSEDETMEGKCREHTKDLIDAIDSSNRNPTI